MSKYLGSKFLADVLADTLSGLSTATNAVITTADTILSALGKLQAQITGEASRATTAEALLAPKASPNLTGNVGLTNTAAGGAGLYLSGDGATTPNKVIRASGGELQILDSAATAFLARLTNSGILILKGGISSEAMFFPDPSTIDASGTSDSTTGIQAAINACQTAGGGIVQLPYGVFKISSTLTVTKSGVRVRGAGHGAFHDVAPFVQAGTLLLWNGSVGGTMMTVGPVVSISSQKLTGCAVTDIAFQGTADLVTAKAAYGLVVTSTQHSEFDIYCAEFSAACLAFACTTTALAEAANCEGNIIRIRFRQINLSGSALQFGGSSQGNACFNTAELVYGYIKNGIGIDFQDCDNNIVDRAWIDRVTGGTGTTVYFRSDSGAASGVGGCARANTIRHLSGSVHTNSIYAEGTEKAGASTASYGNRVELWDNANLAPSITWGTGATFFYNHNTSAIGIRESSSTHITHTNGLIDFWGTTGSLGANTTSSITVGSDFNVSSILNVTGSLWFGIANLQVNNWNSRSDSAVNKFDVVVTAVSGGTGTAVVSYRGTAVSNTR